MQIYAPINPIYITNAHPHLKQISNSAAAFSDGGLVAYMFFDSGGGKVIYFPQPLSEYPIYFLNAMYTAIGKVRVLNDD